MKCKHREAKVPEDWPEEKKIEYFKFFEEQEKARPRMNRIREKTCGGKCGCARPRFVKV